MHFLRTAQTEYGTVQGFPAADPRITAFKGVPYAKPPIGDLRWRAPQPCDKWEGTKECFRFGPASMQGRPYGDPKYFYDREWHVDPDIAISEDSLYLNIWTPAHTPDEKLPVMVWFYGGGFVDGYTAEMEFDGERIARRGVILVSVGYRVNAFGFLSTPEMMEEDPENGAGNFGLLDQRFSLIWVKNNIAAFGGDPDNVTIFGQSAGGGSVLSHLASQRSRGLFHKAIMQSGGGLRAYGQGSRMIPLDKALSNGKEFLDYLGVSSLNEARKLDSETILNAAGHFQRNRFWQPTIDGKFLLEDPSDTLVKMGHADVPCMYGYTSMEYDNIMAGPIESVEELKKFAADKFGDSADEFLELCNVSSDAEAKELYIKDDTFKGRSIQNIAFAMKQVEFGRKGNYLYRFGPTIPGDNRGPYHSSDLWFVFETLAKCWRPFEGYHYDLARKICNYWTNFAKFGDPNGLDANGKPMPEWKEYTKDEPFIIALDDEIHPYTGYMTPLMKFRLDYVFNKLLKK